jgi:hypothetical protein
MLKALAEGKLNSLLPVCGTRVRRTFGLHAACSRGKKVGLVNDIYIDSYLSAMKEHTALWPFALHTRAGKEKKLLAVAGRIEFVFGLPVQFTGFYQH